MQLIKVLLGNLVKSRKYYIFSSELILAQVNNTYVIKLRPEDRLYAFLVAFDGNNDAVDIALAVIKQYLSDFLKM